jgi:hypothetical protein
LAAPQHGVDLACYQVTDANTHITSDLANLTLGAKKYTGPDKVQVGSSQGLPIHHTGSSLFPTSLCNFHLPHILHIPKIQKKSYFC